MEIPQIIYDSSESDLIELLKKKGIARQQRLFKMTQFQIQDANQTSSIVQYLHAQAAEARQQADAVSVEISQYAKEIADLQSANEKHRTKISDLKAQKGSLLQGIEQPEQKAREALGKFEEKKFKWIYTELEKETPKALVSLLEAFVAFLRNAPSADNIDVELYLKDFKKLTWKLNKFDSSTFTYNTVVAHRKTFTKWFNQGENIDVSVRDHIEILHFAYYFSEVSERTLRKNELDNKINELEKQVRSNESAEQRINKVKDARVNDLDEVAFYNSKAADLEARVGDITKFVNRDQDQAQEYKERYAQYETDYFARITKSCEQEKRDRRSRGSSAGRASRASRSHIL